MLGRGEDRIGRGERGALEAAHLRLGHPAAEIGILARALDDAAPARIAGNVDHRREGPVEPGSACLDGGNAGGACFDRWIPARRHRQRHREDGAIAVDHVSAEQERDAEPRFFHRDPLHLARFGGAGDIEIGTDAPLADARALAIVDQAVRRALAPAGDLDELAHLLGDRHSRQQGFDPRRRGLLRRSCHPGDGQQHGEQRPLQPHRPPPQSAQAASSRWSSAAPLP